MAVRLCYHVEDIAVIHCRNCNTPEATESFNRCLLVGLMKIINNDEKCAIATIH